MDIKVTEAAKVKLYDMGVSEDTFLRIGVKSGGCSGNTYDAVLDDKITDGCWTNLKEVREYSEEKLRSNRLKVVDFDGEYTLEIQGLGQRTLHCHAYVSIKIKSTGNNADGIASDALILLTRQSFIYSETKLNTKIIGFMKAFFNEF